MSIGMLLISVELVMMLFILLFLPRDYAGACFIGFAIGESLGASALRIAGGIFTKIADIGSDLMKIVFNIKEDDARNPGVIADCTGDNAGDSVGPSADGFETYGVTGVALITFILLAVTDAEVQVQLLVWIFAMRIMMIVTSGLSYLFNEAIVKARYGQRRQDALRGAADAAGVGDVAGVGRDDVHRVVPAGAAPGRRRRQRQPVVEAFAHHHLRHAGGRDHPGDDQDLHVDLVQARQGGRHGVPRRRPVAQHPVGPDRRQLQRLLDGARHRRPHGHRLRRQLAGRRGDHEGAGGVRVRPGRLRLPGHGPGHDRGRLLRPGHRQRAVGLRAVASSRRSRASRKRSRRPRAGTSTSSAPSTCSRRTTAPATPSRRPPSPC